MSATYPSDLYDTFAAEFYGPHRGSHGTFMSSRNSTSLVGIREGKGVDALPPELDIPGGLLRGNTSIPTRPSQAPHTRRRPALALGRMREQPLPIRGRHPPLT